MPDGDPIDVNTPIHRRPCFWRQIFFFFPALVILIIGIAALFTSYRAIYMQRDMLNRYQDKVVEIIQDVQVKQELSEIESVFYAQEEWLFVAIIVMFFAGVLLLFLNVQQFLRSRNIRDEREGNSQLLEQRLAALEATKDGVGIADVHGNLIYMNPALMTLHGITLQDYEELLGKSWLELYSGENKADIKKNILPIFARDGYWTGEIPVERKDGKVFSAEMSLTRLPDGGAIGTARDISERKQNEREKQELQEQFYQAQKMEAIGRLAGGVAHDFNNILASINGYAEFLIDDIDEATPQHEFAQNIRKAGLQARGLVDQILSFSRKSDVSTQFLDLNVPLEECLSMLNASLSKTIELEANITAKPAPIEGNATQISQIIMNLCVNAIDAMDNDRGWLKISLGHADPHEFLPREAFRDELPNTKDMPRLQIEEVAYNNTRLYLNTVAEGREYFCLSIEDTGHGMGRRVMERIFEPFFTTKPVEKGTGLGLANVHGVIQALRGAMVIDSVTSQGTSFHLLFPVSYGSDDENTDTDVEILEDIEATILLVEDQEDVQQMTLKMLERMGYEAYAAGTGLEALDILRENPGVIDLVVTDQNMPKMTGLELIYQANINWPDLPFILLSGYSEEKLKALIEEHPAVKDVVRKPVSKNDLAEKIHRVLSDVARQKKS